MTHFVGQILSDFLQHIIERQPLSLAMEGFSFGALAAS